MNELAKLMIRSGILTTEQMAQFQKWGVMPDSEVQDPEFQDANEFVKEIDSALQKEEMVLVRETDFNALHTYLKHQDEGTLTLVTPDGAEAEMPIRYAVLKTGEYIIPWNGDNVADLLINGKTWLHTAKLEHVHFYEARELYYDSVKAFVVCRPIPLPSKVDPDATVQP